MFCPLLSTTLCLSTVSCGIITCVAERISCWNCGFSLTLSNPLQVVIMPGMLKCHLNPQNYCQRYWSYCGHGPHNILAWIYSVGLNRGVLMSATLSTFFFPSCSSLWIYNDLSATAAFFLHPESPVSPLFPQHEHQKYPYWKSTIIYCMLQGLPGPMFTEVSHT